MTKTAKVRLKETTTTTTTTKPPDRRLSCNNSLELLAARNVCFSDFFWVIFHGVSRGACTETIDDSKLGLQYFEYFLLQSPPQDGRPFATRSGRASKWPSKEQSCLCFVYVPRSQGRCSSATLSYNCFCKMSKSLSSKNVYLKAFLDLLSTRLHLLSGLCKSSREVGKLGTRICILSQYWAIIWSLISCIWGLSLALSDPPQLVMSIFSSYNRLCNQFFHDGRPLAVYSPSHSINQSLLNLALTCGKE